MRFGEIAAFHFYRAMHYSANSSLVIALSSVHLSVTLVDHDHIG